MAYAIGVDLGGTNMRAALVDSQGKILAHARTKTPVEEGPEATAREMARIVKEVHGSQQVLGVGIGSPGPLSRSEKMIYQSANLPGFDRFPLGKRVEELTGLSVALDNDAKCATYGEALFGRAKGRKNFILMTFGTGIGAGIIVENRMIYGKSDGACEVGHLTLYPDGKLCKCGNRGCFEQYASATAFKARGSTKSGQEIGGKDIFDAFARGQKWADELMREFTIDLAIGTATLVNLFDPELVVFGGGLFTTGGGPLCAWVQEAIKDRCFKSSQKGLEIAASTLAGDAGVLGAASLIFRKD
jgi:glucokinase